MDEASLENLRLAYERTALAWVRTSLALIGFGFTIDKLFEAQSRREGAGGFVQPHVIGITMIAAGLIALALFVYELRRFHRQYPQMPRSVAGFVAAMIGILGIMALIFAIAT
jgi:putative membrane protein